MRSAQPDLTAKALIRDRALTLFAAKGPDAVSVREIATAAGVSPALVVHHYGSKQGLREAVDAHVAGLFDHMFAAVTSDPTTLVGDDHNQAAGSLAELMLASLPTDSAVPAYLRWLLLSGDAAGRELFRRWFALSVALCEQLITAGVMLPTGDLPVRAAFLMANDVALILLREHLSDALGVDPLTPDGMQRWAANVLAAYTEGVFISEAT